MPNRKKDLFITAVVANSNGEIFDLEGYAAVGMSGPCFTPLTMKNTVSMPYGGELMFLPDRQPVLYNMEEQCFETLLENPYSPGEKLFPVAAFNSPGYVNSYACAFKEDNGAGPLPLFSYGAVGWTEDSFRSAVIVVDAERRQDLRLMKYEKIISGVENLRKKMPTNRLREHIEKCALKYGCPAAKNFFLGRYEAPLPTSGHCNARCIGCISLQKNSSITPPQERIRFTPRPEEIAQVALWHITNVGESIVSFGQGCEGDPLMAADIIGPAITKIRSETLQGTINMNTNGSRPEVLDKLFDAGLDSVRISMNSAREESYNKYFKPKGYLFAHVEKSIEIAVKRNKFVSINYLNCPGVADMPREADALNKFLSKHPINMIQWRNLNYDPLKYWNIMCKAVKDQKPMGMKKLLKKTQKAFPDLKYGYFNPPKERF
jgi:pyruvate-formate lyase-activating enzyme